MKDFSTIQEGVDHIKKGNLLIVVDNPKREDEGDFYIPADHVTPKIMLHMIRYGGGLICVAITQKQAERLALPLMISPEENTEKTKVNFTVSFNARRGIGSGISAFDRARTIRIVANPKSKPRELTRPGHVFGLVAKQGGVLERGGHTEAAVDLARLSGLTPAGVLCEIIGSHGRMAKRKDLIKLSKKFHIPIISIDDLKIYLTKRDNHAILTSS